MFLQLVAFVMYLVLMILIGFKFMKDSNSSEDFYLGGRNLGPWTTALSAEASDMSGWLLMGLPDLWGHGWRGRFVKRNADRRD